MLRLLFSFLLTSTLLFAVSAKQELDLAKKNLYSSSKERQFRAYDTYKLFYIKALINGDTAQQERCLNGICIAGKKLRIDVSDYKKKLKKIEKTGANKRAHKKVVASVIKTEKIKPTKKSKSKKVKIRSQHAFENFRWEGRSLVLSFDFKLKSQDVNYLWYKLEGTKGYRYIFEVDAILQDQPTIKHKEINRIVVAQYKPKVIRISIDSASKLKPHSHRQDKQFVIDLGVSKVYAPKAKLQSRVSTKNKLIIIDPGHGGRDGGAVGYKRHLEKDIVLAISKRLAKILKQDGYNVKMTRYRDKTVSLKDRTKFIRNNKASLFISIHANSVPKKNALKAKGIEIYFLDKNRGSQRSSRLERKENAVDYNAMGSSITKNFSARQSREKVKKSNFLAIDMGENIVSRLREKGFKTKDAKVDNGNFWVLVGATSAAVLVEVGFVSNPKEVKLLINKSYQQTFAEGLADGVDQYFRNQARW